MAKPRLSSVFLSIALAVSILAALNFFLGRNAERARRIWTEGQLRKVTDAKELLEKERDELTQAKDALEGQLAESSTQVKSLTEEAKKVADQLSQEKRAREALTTELARSKSTLETERKEKLTLTEELAKAKQSYQALSNELVTLRQAKEALEKRVKEMLSSQAQEAEKIVVRPGPAGVAPGGAAYPPGAGQGKVLVVNRDFNFVVVNLGSKDGLKVGATLSIWRGTTALGKAQVERVYENMSAATLLTEEQKGQIREGDLVQPVS